MVSRYSYRAHPSSVFASRAQQSWPRQSPQWRGLRSVANGDGRFMYLWTTEEQGKFVPAQPDGGRATRCEIGQWLSPSKPKGGVKPV